MSELSYMFCFFSAASFGCAACCLTLTLRVIAFPSLEPRLSDGFVIGAMVFSGIMAGFQAVRFVAREMVERIKEQPKEPTHDA